MYAAVDSTFVDMQPIRDNNLWMIVLFFFFMIIGCFLMTNLFVGVIISNFNRLKEQKEKEMQGDVFMTETQRQWVMTKKLLLHMISLEANKLGPPAGEYRAKAFGIVQHPDFEKYILGCIILNTFIMAMQHFGQVDGVTAFVDGCNLTFAMIFNVEAILKIYALDKRYFAIK